VWQGNPLQLDIPFTISARWLCSTLANDSNEGVIAEKLPILARSCSGKPTSDMSLGNTVSELFKAYEVEFTLKMLVPALFAESPVEQ
jgi:hypothetical protein